MTCSLRGRQGRDASRPLFLCRMMPPRRFFLPPPLRTLLSSPSSSPFSRTPLLPRSGTPARPRPDASPLPLSLSPFSRTPLLPRSGTPARHRPDAPLSPSPLPAPLPLPSPLPLPPPFPHLSPFPPFPVFPPQQHTFFIPSPNIFFILNLKSQHNLNFFTPFLLSMCYTGDAGTSCELGSPAGEPYPFGNIPAQGPFPKVPDGRCAHRPTRGGERRRLKNNRK